MPPPYVTDLVALSDVEVLRWERNSPPHPLRQLPFLRRGREGLVPPPPPPPSANAAWADSCATERRRTPHLPMRSIPPDLPLFRNGARLVRHEVCGTREPRRDVGSHPERFHPRLLTCVYYWPYSLWVEASTCRLAKRKAQ